MGTRLSWVTGIILSACCLLQLPALAADLPPVAAIVIEHPWSRPTDAMAQTAAAYFVVKNNSDVVDTLISVSTDAAGIAELHTNLNDGGMMRMKHVAGIDIPAHGSATLKPGGFHVMLMDLKGQLKEGSAYALKLKFEKAGEVTVTVKVERPASGMGTMDHGAMQGMK